MQGSGPPRALGKREDGLRTPLRLTAHSPHGRGLCRLPQALSSEAPCLTRALNWAGGSWGADRSPRAGHGSPEEQLEEPLTVAVSSRDHGGREPQPSVCELESQESGLWLQPDCGREPEWRPWLQCSPGPKDQEGR